MIRRPPRSTRTDTLFPYTTLFRSTSDDILGGTPVIRGTRVPVYDVSAAVVAGRPIQRILDAWPSLDAEKVRLAAIYAEANPLRGRPRVSGDLPEGATIVTDRRVPRRRKDRKSTRRNSSH